MLYEASVSSDDSIPALTHLAGWPPFWLFGKEMSTLVAVVFDEVVLSLFLDQTF